MYLGGNHRWLLLYISKQNVLSRLHVNETLTRREGWPRSHLYKLRPVKQFAIKTSRLQFPWIQTGLFSYTSFRHFKARYKCHCGWRAEQFVKTPAQNSGDCR